MKSNTKTLTEGPLAKQIFLVSLPLALSNLLQVLFNMSDVAVVGRFAGSTALGAVGSTSILVSLFTGFLIGLSGGINVLVARFYGARHEHDVEKTVHSAAIVLAGDISWAMRLTDTRRDFAFLQSLPGQKIIMKGNHDYWWSTANKMNAYLKAEGFDTLHILHNNSYSVEGYAICGTRGWLFDVGEPHDEKVMNREIGRLRMSLDAAEPGLEKLVFLHYPPVYTGISAPEIVATLKEYGIRTCYYGHLHGNAIRYAVQGEVDGIRYKLVSADGLRFCPYRIN